MSRFEDAIAGFYEAHAEDPRTLEVAGETHNHSVRYHQRMQAWLERLAPDASEALRLAVACQHIRRWDKPRSDYPEGRAGYKKWRAMLAIYHGEVAGEILAEAGYDAATISRVGEILQKRRLRSDPEVQLFEDVVCLVFLENELVDFAGKHPEDKLVDILQKTWAKMSPRGHEAALALAGSLPDDLREVVVRAVG